MEMWRAVGGVMIFDEPVLLVKVLFVVFMRGKETSSSSSVPVSSPPRRLCDVRPCRRRATGERRIFGAVLARNQLGWVSSASYSRLSRESKPFGPGMSFGDRGASVIYRGVVVVVSADLDAARFSRDSSLVPNKAVFRSDPLRRRVLRCCCTTADIALAPAVASLGMEGGKPSLSPSCSMVWDFASDCADA